MNTITTSIGEVEFYVNDGTNVYIGCKSGTRVVVRGVQYYASAHLELKDGEWVILRGDYRNLHASRDDWRKEPSASARKAILAAFAAAWTEYVTPELLAEADRRKASQAVCDLENEIAAAEQAIENKRAELEGKRAELQEKIKALASLTS